MRLYKIAMPNFRFSLQNSLCFLSKADELLPASMEISSFLQRLPGGKAINSAKDALITISRR
jgi:hypothetical protein